MMLDREFHQAITRMTKNSFLEDEMNITLDLCLRLLFLNQDSLGSGIDSTDIQEYESIYQALWDQNAEELVKELKKMCIRDRCSTPGDPDCAVRSASHLFCRGFFGELRG